MNFKNRLAQRIHMNDIHEICLLIQKNTTQKQELYNLIFDPDDTIAYQALWVCSHFSPEENKWLYSKQNELINEVLVCPHSGKRRILLNLLLRQPLNDRIRVDFLDFCMERMISQHELPGVQSLCMKMAYKLCLSLPELLDEFRITLEIIEPELLPISLRTVRKNILKAMKAKKLNTNL